MNRLSKPVARHSFLVFSALLVSLSQPSLAAYDVGPQPSTTVPEVIQPGQGLDLDTDLVDTDFWSDGTASAHNDNTVSVTEVTVIDPCGNGETFFPSGTRGSGGDWTTWTPTSAGNYLVRVVMDDSDGGLADDPPHTMFFTVRVPPSAGGCSSCANTPGAMSAELDGVSFRINLGKTVNGEPAGVLWLHETEPSATLISASSLHYGLNAEMVDKEYTSATDFLVKTPAYQIEVETRNACTVWIHLYAIVAGVKVNDELKRWEITDPSPGATHDNVQITEVVVDNGNPVTRVIYSYDLQANRDWNLTTKDSQGTPVQAETEEWTSLTNDAYGRARMRRDYQRLAGSGCTTPVYCDQTDYTQFTLGWRRTKQVVDPATAMLTTEWTYDDSADGLTLRSEKRADGSWTFYSSGPNILTMPDPNDVVMTEVSGWLDNGFPAYIPSWSTSGTHSIVMTYDNADDFRVGWVTERIDGYTVRSTEYNYTLDGHDLESTEVVQHVNSNELTTVMDYVDGYEDEPRSVQHPDRTVDQYETTALLSFDDSTTPPTYTTTSGAGDEDYAGYRCKTQIKAYQEYGNATILLSANASLKTTQILSNAGRLLLSEVFVWDGSDWRRIDWTSYEYDPWGRVVATHWADGTSETTGYTSCCSRTVTGRDGVATTYTYDALQRLESVATRVGTATDSDEPVATVYDYDTAGQVSTYTRADDSTTTSATTRTYDLAGRLASVLGPDGLKTLYKYETSGNGGRVVKVFSGYPAAATDGIAGTRDHVTTYYRDGNVESITGSTVVQKHYRYEVASGERTTTVIEGAAFSGTLDPAVHRYTKTVYDILGRVKQTERPGWSATGPAPVLTATYHYANLLPAQGAPGQLYLVEYSHAPDVLYYYTPLGDRYQTVIDVDGDEFDDPTDRHYTTLTTYEPNAPDGKWARITRSYTSGAGVSQTLTGVAMSVVDPNALAAAGIVARSYSYDAFGNETVSTTEIDTQDHTVTQTTDTPDSSTNAVRVTRAGSLVQTTSSTGVVNSFEYDKFGRQETAFDGRGKPTVTAYDDDTGQVESVTDPNGNVTTYAYYDDEGANPGRLYSVEIPGGALSYYRYNDRGQTTHTWGHVPYPTLVEYDDFGQRIKLTTFSDTSLIFTGSSWPTGVDDNDGDTTTWNYDGPTGLLESKVYADPNSHVNFTYYPNGQPYVRTWARNSGAVTTTYSYNDGTNSRPYTWERIGIDYSDTTPDVTFTHDGIGRVATVTDGTGKREFGYDATSLALANEEYIDDQNANVVDLFFGKLVTQVHEGSGEAVQGRFKGLQIGVTGTPDAEYSAVYTYDTVGRLGTVTGPGLPDGGATYGYYDVSPNKLDLVTSLDFKDADDDIRLHTQWDYEPNRPLVASMNHTWYDNAGSNPETFADYGYTYNERSERTKKTRTGAAFPVQPYHEDYVYNDRGELVSSTVSDAGVPTPDHAYTYDPIGNRRHDEIDGTTHEYYCPNALNQYVTVDDEATCPATTPLLTFVHDDDGNLVDDGTHTLTYDAENRLIKIEPKSPTTGSTQVKYVYDYRNRRVQRTVYRYVSGDWQQTPTRQTRYLWDGWLVLAEYDGLDPNLPLMRSYTWGLDLAGQRGGPQSGRYMLEAAGGIGGLLAVAQTEHHNVRLLELPPIGLTLDGDYVYTYDANGNVGQLVDLRPTTWNDPNVLAARYEYSPFGEVTRTLGWYADVNRYRFSTKPFDEDTDLGYWGERWYWPAAGRWITRDPIGELGGKNLYAYSVNSPAMRYDSTGRLSLAAGTTTQPTTCPKDSSLTSQPASGATSQPSGDAAAKKRCEDVVADMRANDETFALLSGLLASNGCNVPPISCVTGGKCDTPDYAGWTDYDGNISICAGAGEDNTRRYVRHELTRVAWECAMHGPGADGLARPHIDDCATEIKEVLWAIYAEAPGESHAGTLKRMCSVKHSYCDHPYYIRACPSVSDCEDEWRKQMKGVFNYDCK